MGICGPRETYLASEEVTRRYGRWRAPDQDKAALLHRAEHAHHDFFDVWSSRVREFKEFGVGHMMYFYFLYWMSALFIALSVITGIPNMALSSIGRYYESGALEMTTLGNFGITSWSHNYDGAAEVAKLTAEEGWQREAFISNLLMNASSAAPATSPINKQSAIVAMSVVDMVGVVVYFVVTSGLIWAARKLAHEADMHTVTLHDYSIRVEGLPVDSTAEELAGFFNQYGDVVHVEMVRAYGELVCMVLKRGRLLHRLQAATAALQKEAQDWHEVPASKEAACYKIKEQIETLSSEIEAQQGVADSYRVVGAFVTFKDEGGKMACLKAQPGSSLRKWWTLKPEHKLRRRHRLKISEAPEPSDVQFENIEYDAMERFVRSFLVACCSYSCLAAGFALISLASAMRLNLTQAAGVRANECSTNCRLMVNGALGITEQDRELYAACGTSGVLANGTQCASADTMCYRCYCLKAITAGMLGETLYCRRIANVLALEYSSQGLIVLVILFINTVLSTTSKMLTLFEKHHTRSMEAKSQAHKLFLAQFLNSALSTILANAHLPFLSSAMEGTAVDGIFFQGVFTDLTPNWYKLVGRSLVLSQIVGALLRVVNLVIKWAQKKYRQKQFKKYLTQHELQKRMRGPKFELDQRYGEHLNIIYVTLLLSSGMPVFYLTAAFWFVSSYWCDKYELLTMSRRPITYGADLSNMVIGRLPFAAVWHVMFAVWAFSIFGVPKSALAVSVFANMISKICNGMSSVWQSVSGISPGQAAQRLLAANSLHLLMLLIIFVGLLFLNIIRANLLQAVRWLLATVGVMSDKEETEVSGVPEFPVAVRTQLLVGETSYAIQAQPAYAAAFSKMEDAIGDVLVQVVLRRQGPLLAAVGQRKAQISKQHSPRVQPELQAPAQSSSSEQQSQRQIQQQQPQNQSSSAGAVPVRTATVLQDAGDPDPVLQEQQQAARRSSLQQATDSPQLSSSGYPSGVVEARPDVKTSHGGTNAQGPNKFDPVEVLESKAQQALQQQVQQLQGEQPRSSDRSNAGPARASSTPDKLSLPQKYRQARASQVVPVPEEYVAAARAADRANPSFNSD